MSCASPLLARPALVQALGCTAAAVAGRGGLACGAGGTGSTGLAEGPRRTRSCLCSTRLLRGLFLDGGGGGGGSARACDIYMYHLTQMAEFRPTLWPNGIFFTKLDGYKWNAGTSQFGKQSLGSPNQAVGNKKSSTSSFELQLEASRNASEVKKLLLDGTPSTLVSIIGYKQYRRSARDMYYFLQSNVCIKQLAYAMLEQVLVTVFPELRQLIDDIHEKGRKDQASFTYQL
ncbi:unnamed protein product [Miscanthus lutarioriparius]|uniref:Sorting nexin C-terminal domain-containing protein n=1 Tax=Miscanthus lutarioriparius TaxID=422564 RepID=A0A811Q4A3_9POAL|nr:unnamed protein product [Miscanthus lutarioriparius]